MKKGLYTILLMLTLLTLSFIYAEDTEDLHDTNILKQHFDNAQDFEQWYNELNQEDKNLVLAGTVYACYPDLTKKALAQNGDINTKLMIIRITSGHDEDSSAYIYANNSGNAEEFWMKVMDDVNERSDKAMEKESCGHTFSGIMLETSGSITLLSAGTSFCEDEVQKTKMLQLLMTNGSDINETNDWHVSPLSEAIEQKNIKMVDFLLQNGADFSKTYALSKMIDNYYSHKSDEKTEAMWDYVIAYLKEHKLTPEAETDAYIRGRLKYEEEFKSKMERLSLQPDYNTLAAKEGLLAAADRYGHDLLRELIDNGVDVNYQDEYGRTALFFIVKKASDPEDVYDAKYLLDNGADANIKDHNGKTAFDSCSERTCLLDPKKK